MIVFYRCHIFKRCLTCCKILWQRIIVATNPALLPRTHNTHVRANTNTHYKWCSPYGSTTKSHDGTRKFITVEEGERRGSCFSCYDSKGIFKRSQNWIVLNWTYMKTLTSLRLPWFARATNSRVVVFNWMWRIDWWSREEFLNGYVYVNHVGWDVALLHLSSKRQNG